MKDFGLLEELFFNRKSIKFTWKLKMALIRFKISFLYLKIGCSQFLAFLVALSRPELRGVFEGSLIKGLDIQSAPT